MQAQVVHVHISMATIANIVMKGKSPPSIMCTTTTNDIYYELKYDNDTIIMKMLEMRKRKSPNKPYFTPSPSFMGIREDRETTTTKTALRYYHHHFGIFAKCYQGIFAFGRTTYSPTSHEYAYNDFIKSKAATYKRGRHFHLRKPPKEDGRAWEIPFGHGDELRGATSYGPATTRRRQEG